MKVLIVGSGGREHALAWKCLQSERVEKVFVAPGNAGTALEQGIENIAIAATDIEALIDFAKSQQVALTIIGPEQPLVAGITDRFQQQNLPCFGPSKAAAQLEGSKAFSKHFLQKHDIPTASYATFNQVDKAKQYVKQQGTPIVIKADGLAAGKGVIVAKDESTAFLAIDDMLEGNRFGDAGHLVVIEEFLEGEEASFIVMADGINVLPFATSQDHKARDNGDKGPNTGGMGAYSPAPVVTSEIHQRIMEMVIKPTIEGMAADGMPYVGFLYAGLMINKEGLPKVIEFNCRFGDPETQPIMMRLESDLPKLCLSALEGKLEYESICFDSRTCLGVVMASGGYPDSYQKHLPITGLSDDKPDIKVFHAGTELSDQGQIQTCGGRVLCVSSLGENVTQAQKKAYTEVKQIHWRDVYFRDDIGYRAIARENVS